MIKNNNTTNKIGLLFSVNHRSYTWMLVGMVTHSGSYKNGAVSQQNKSGHFLTVNVTQNNLKLKGAISNNFALNNQMTMSQIEIH